MNYCEVFFHSSASISFCGKKTWTKKYLNTTGAFIILTLNIRPWFARTQNEIKKCFSTVLFHTLVHNNKTFVSQQSNYMECQITFPSSSKSLISFRDLVFQPLMAANIMSTNSRSYSVSVELSKSFCASIARTRMVWKVANFKSVNISQAKLQHKQ